MLTGEPALSVSWDPNGTLRLGGELDFASCPLLRAAIESTDPQVTSIDLTALTFIDAGGLAEFIHAHNRGRVTISNAPSQIARVFRLGMVDHLLDAA